MQKPVAKIQNKTKNIHLTKQRNWIRVHRANSNIKSHMSQQKIIKGRGKKRVKNPQKTNQADNSLYLTVSDLSEFLASLLSICHMIIKEAHLRTHQKFKSIVLRVLDSTQERCEPLQKLQGFILLSTLGIISPLNYLLF